MSAKPAELWPCSDGQEIARVVAQRIHGTAHEASRGLGGHREWLKFSYLWIASRAYSAEKAAPNLRRVISDPLTSRAHAREKEVLLCEPEHEFRYKVHDLGRSTPSRGDLLAVKQGAQPPRPLPAARPREHEIESRDARRGRGSRR